MKMISSTCTKTIHSTRLWLAISSKKNKDENGIPPFVFSRYRQHVLGDPAHSCMEEEFVPARSWKGWWGFYQFLLSCMFVFCSFGSSRCSQGHKFIIRFIPSSSFGIIIMCQRMGSLSDQCRRGSLDARQTSHSSRPDGHPYQFEG